MSKNLSLVSRNKSSVFLLVLALIVCGVGAQATGLLNTASGGYLVCVNSTTKVVTHPGTSSCPKGSKKLVLGAQGAAGTNGLTGATGMSGKDGVDGKDGKTLWNGVKDPESSLGAPGDMFINSATKTLFGPKNIDGTWPAGVSMMGPKGDQGLIGLTGATGDQGQGGGRGPAGAAGTNATIAITELSVCDGPDVGTVADEKCKIGMAGPGGGLIFFVDYHDQYLGFNYLEVARVMVCGARITWSSNDQHDVVAAAGWQGRAVGAGKANTAAIKTVYNRDEYNNNAAYFATDCNSGSKNDWFLGSLGEMKLMYDNLQGLGEFGGEDYFQYWSSSQEGTTYAKSLDFNSGLPSALNKTSAGVWVRPIRSF